MTAAEIAYVAKLEEDLAWAKQQCDDLYQSNLAVRKERDELLEKLKDAGLR